MFNPPRKQLDHELKINLNGKKIYQTYSVKYLGIYVDKNLTWKHHVNNIAIKFSTANAMLSKTRYYADKKKLYYQFFCAIFESHLSYASLVYAQNSSLVKRLSFFKKNRSRRPSLQKLQNFKNLVTK